ncbi:hypothetical protein [Pseudomonas putida]|uniref:Uncharacterized protein n=1 Tax=Pseudomonas putida TaxID=303 RepID=A0A177SFA7_PSEPU|nr:hypothetical protein [Pseudomonas putida]OAI86177.1 hypothetical protein AYO28_00340 [Pseudomonas putida]
MTHFTLDYLFNDTPQTRSFELEQAELPLHEAAMHLLVLHFGDSENSLVMPSADATPQEILEQAERLGLTRIEVAGR